MATFNLGLYYNLLGNYRQAVHYHRKNVEALVGEWLYERLGEAGLLSVSSRSWLVRSLAELGDFIEGHTQGAEAVRIAETVEQPFTLSNAYLGIGFLHLRQGDLPQAIARLEKGLEICQTTDVSAPAPVGCRGVRICLYAVWPPRRGPATARTGHRADCRATYEPVSALGRPSR